MTCGFIEISLVPDCKQLIKFDLTHITFCNKNVISTGHKASSVFVGVFLC